MLTYSIEIPFDIFHRPSYESHSLRTEYLGKVIIEIHHVFRYVNERHGELFVMTYIHPFQVRHFNRTSLISFVNRLIRSSSTGFRQVSIR